MIPTTIGGVPTHPLLVHAVVVLVPLTALLVILGAAWPSAARRLGGVTPVAAVLTVALIPVTTDAGEWLQRRIAPTPLIAAHAVVADDLLPWQVAVAVLAVALWWLRRQAGRIGDRTAESTATQAGRGPAEAGGAVAVEPARAAVRAPVWVRPVTLLLAALAVVAAAGSVVEVYLIGESGAKAVWQGQFSPTAAPRPPRTG